MKNEKMPLAPSSHLAPFYKNWFGAKPYSLSTGYLILHPHFVQNLVKHLKLPFVNIRWQNKLQIWFTSYLKDESGESRAFQGSFRQ
jgi:hypothetical protein